MYTATALFEALRRLGASRFFFSHADVFDMLHQLMNRGRQQPGHVTSSWLSEQMQQLEELGFILANPESTDVDPLQRAWRVNPDWGRTDGAFDDEPGDDRFEPFRKQRPPAPPPFDGGRPGGDGNDGNGPGGFGDVLAHPHLFVVSSEDFDEAIQRALGRP